MIDIKLIRENADIVKENIRKKFQDEKLVIVDQIKELLKTEFNNDNIIISGVDAVIGCHTGPTVLAIVYLDELYGKYDIFEI